MTSPRTGVAPGQQAGRQAAVAVGCCRACGAGRTASVFLRSSAAVLFFFVVVGGNRGNAVGLFGLREEIRCRETRWKTGYNYLRVRFQFTPTPQGREERRGVEEERRKRGSVEIMDERR